MARHQAGEVTFGGYWRGYYPAPASMGTPLSGDRGYGLIGIIGLSCPRHVFDIRRTWRG